MSGTGDLFDDIIPDSVMPPHIRDSETSREAAIQLKPIFGKKMKAILAMYRSRGPQGATCEEVEIALGMKHQTVSSAIVALERRGHVHTTATKRLNQSRALAFVVKIGRGDKPQEGPSKPRHKFRRGQKVSYHFQAPQGLNGEATSVSGWGEVTGKLALKGGLQYIVSDRWVCAESELAKVGEKPPASEGGGQAA